MVDLRADDVEQLIVQSIFDRPLESEDQPDPVEFWRIKRCTLDGDRYVVDVHPPRLSGAVVRCRVLRCESEARDAALELSHEHDDRTCHYVTVNDHRTRAWTFIDTKDAILAALRWDPESEAEPYGWTRALDGTGRFRPNGDPLREMSGDADVLEGRS